jgi:ParB family chromosome partitioning protein
MPGAMRRTVEKRRARDLKAKPQVRKSFPAEEVLRQLGRSVIRRQIHPLIILPDNTILDGECRWRGVMLENTDHELDVIVADRELTQPEITELQLISALHSTSLPPHDQAVACRDWLAANPGATAKELAEKLDRDPSMLTRLASLWKTVAEVQQAAAEGRIGPGDWYAISKLPEAEQAEALALKLSGASRDTIEQHARKRRTGTAPAVKMSRVKIALPQGAMVVVTGNEMSMAEVVELLSQTLKEARRAAEQFDVRTFQSMMRDKARGA